MTDRFADKGGPSITEDKRLADRGEKKQMLSTDNILDLAQQTKALAEKATPEPWAINMGHREAKCDADFIDFTRTAAPQLADAVIEMVEALRFYATKEPNYSAKGECILQAPWDNGCRAAAALTKLGIGGDNNG